MCLTLGVGRVHGWLGDADAEGVAVGGGLGGEAESAEVGAGAETLDRGPKTEGEEQRQESQDYDEDYDEDYEEDEKSRLKAGLRTNPGRAPLQVKIELGQLLRNRGSSLLELEVAFAGEDVDDVALAFECTVRPVPMRAA